MSADLLKRLIEAGTPAELIAEVAMLAARADADRDLIESRRAKDRDRKRPRNSTESEESAEIQASPSPVFPPNPLSTPTRNNNPTRVKGSRLDEHWKPEKLTGEAGKLVERHGQQWAKTQFEAFQNFWIAKSGKDACKTDWQRTWANWVLNARGPANTHPPPTSPDSKLAELQRRYGTA